MTPYSGIRWIEELPPWNGVNFTPLSVAEDILSYLGKPQDAYETIHIAGTNGKGTVASLLSRVLTKGSRYATVGLMTSPHLFSINERCIVNGEVISNELLDASLREVKRACIHLNVTPTFFTAITCAIFHIFREVGVDIAVIEVGLGGRNDATNVLTSPLCAVITSIGLDHQEQLGDTLSEIASNKAGIIKSNGTVVIGDVPAEAQEAIIHSVKNYSATPHVYGVDFCIKNGTYISSSGFYQLYDSEVFFPEYLAHNLSLAMRVLELIDYPLDLISQYITGHSWDMRFEIRENKELSSFVIIDGAHNIDGVKALLSDIKKFIHRYKNIKRIIFVCAFLNRKDWRPCFSFLASFTHEDLPVVILCISMTKDFVSYDQYAEIISLRCLDTEEKIKQFYKNICPGDLIVHLGTFRQPECLQEILSISGFLKKPIWRSIYQ